jgi:hypothetical protein
MSLPAPLVPHRPALRGSISSAVAERQPAAVPPAHLGPTKAYQELPSTHILLASVGSESRALPRLETGAAQPWAVPV